MGQVSHPEKLQCCAAYINFSFLDVYISFSFKEIWACYRAVAYIFARLFVLAMFGAFSLSFEGNLGCSTKKATAVSFEGAVTAYLWQHIPTAVDFGKQPLLFDNVL